MGVTNNSPTKGRVEVVQLNSVFTRQENGHGNTPSWLVLNEGSDPIAVHDFIGFYYWKQHFRTFA